MKKKPLLKDFNWRKFIVVLSVFTVLTFLPIVVYLYLSKTVRSVAYTVVEDFTTSDLIDQANSSNYDISEGFVKVNSLSYSNGDGSDGDVIISANTDINTTNRISGRSCPNGGDAVNYSVSALGSNSATLTSSPPSGCLSVGDEVLLINLAGVSSSVVNVGNYEILEVSNISGSTVTFSTNKQKFYGNGTSDDTNIGTAITNQRVMLQRVPQYNNLTVNSGVSFYPSTWNGVKGGVIMFKASGIVTVNGTIHANGRGYLGSDFAATAYTGKSHAGHGAFFTNSVDGEGGNSGSVGGNGTYSGGGGGGKAVNDIEYNGGAGSSAPGATGGGGGASVFRSSSAAHGYGGGGGGGGHGTGGQGGNGCARAGSGTALGSGAGSRGDCEPHMGGGGGGGATFGIADLSKLTMGGGGGSGGSGHHLNKTTYHTGGLGNAGAGIVFVSAETISVNGAVQSNGVAGGAPEGSLGGGGGGGAGGSIKLIGDTVSLGTSMVVASGGAGSGGNRVGGNGGDGRIRVEYLTSFLGTTTPSASTYKLPGYEDSAVLQSLDMVTGDNLVEIESFKYSLSSLPSGTSATLQISNDGVNWEVAPPGVEAFPAEDYSFGDGSDGDVIISVNTNINTDNNITARNGACPDAPSYNVTALTNNTATVTPQPNIAQGCLSVGDEILLINLSGTSTSATNLGKYEVLVVDSINGDIVTFTTNKVNFYGNGENDDIDIGTSSTENQRVILQRIPQYDNLTINSGVSFYPTAWNGTNGGIMMFRVAGQLVVNGTISTVGMGYRGGIGSANWVQNAKAGEGGFMNNTTSGQGGSSNVGSNGTFSGGGGGVRTVGGNVYAGGIGSFLAGSMGGGGGGSSYRTSSAYHGYGGGGGGGGHSSPGGGGYGCTVTEAGTALSSGAGGIGANCTYNMGGGGGGGASYGASDLSLLTMGGGGGGGGGGMWKTINSCENNNCCTGGTGGDGGGIIFISANDMSISGSVTSNAQMGIDATCAVGGDAGGGAGGSVKIVAGSITGDSKITANGTTGDRTGNRRGGDGGDGRVRVEYIDLGGGEDLNPFELTLGVDNEIDLSGFEWLTDSFYYRIAFDTDGGQDTPVLDSVSLTYNAAPDAPTIGTPEALSTSTIRWHFTDNATNEEGFALYDEENNFIQYCLGEDLTYCDEAGLDENTQYIRSVRAYNSSGESASSELAYAYTLVSVPTILEGGSKTVSSLTLSALGQVNGSEIYFDCVDSGCDTGISEWIVDSTDEVTNLNFNTPYTFVVKGRNGDGIETANSENITIYTLAQAPTLSLTPLSSSSITLTAEGVNNVSDGTSGVFFECEELDCNDGISRWENSLESVATSLSPNALYFFRVKSRNYDGVETAFSEYVGTYTKSDIPNVPEVISQTINSITVALVEDDNPEGTQYAVMEETTGKYVDISTGALVDDAVWGTYVQFGADSGKEVVGLGVGTEYTFKSKSRNEDNIESEFSESVTVATKMYSPTLLSALTTTTSSFTWRVTDENELKVGYRIYDAENNLLVTCLVDQMNDCKEENLSSNTEYSRKVKVYSDISESDYSSTFLFTTYSNPSSISSATALSDSAIRLSILGDSEDNLHIIENKSNRYYNKSLKVLTGTSSITPYSATVDVDGLLPNTQYEFKVRSLNKKNVATAWSSNQSTYTHALKPAMVNVNVVSSNSARIYINALDNPSDTELLVRENNSGRYLDFNTGELVSQEVWGTIDSFGSTKGVLVNGLEVGTQYGFSVSARNKLLVKSDWSEGIFIGTGAILENVDTALSTTLATEDSIDLTSRSNAQFGERTVRVKKGEFILADIPVLFNQDRDWNDAVILSSTDERKTVVKLQTTHGVSKPYTMYVNRDDTNGFLLCPTALKLEDVTEECEGGVRFTGTFPNKKVIEGVEITVSQTVIGGVDYWVADGLTGTGGLAFYYKEEKKKEEEKDEKEEEEDSSVLIPLLEKKKKDNFKEDISSPIVDIVKETTYMQKIADVLSSGYEILNNAKDSALGILDNTVVKDLKENELRTASTSANVVTVTVGAAAIFGGLTQLGYTIIQFFAVLLSALGFRKKRVNYGFVYDSNSKEPVHMALVRIYGKGKKIVDTAVTDINGRFSASLKKGKYTLEVSKAEYEFPSMYVKGHVDYPLQNVYTGKLDISSEDADVQVAVPIDPKEILGAKRVFYQIRNILLRILSVVNILIFLIGLTISFYTYFTHENTNNLVLLLLYTIPFIVLVRSFLNRRGRYGKVVNEKGVALPGISLTIKEKEFDKVIAKRVTNKKGRYRFILDKGKYELGVGDKGYELVDVKRGNLIDVRRDNYVLSKRVVVRKI